MQIISIISLTLFSVAILASPAPIGNATALTCRTADNENGLCTAEASCNGVAIEDSDLCSASGSVCCVPDTGADGGEEDGDEGVDTDGDEEEGSLDKRTTCGDKIYAAAKAQVGKKYVKAGGNCAGATHGGFDCSGLVLHAVCKAVKKTLPHKAQLQYSSKKGKKIPRAKAIKGDAIFWATNGNCGSAIKHVGLVRDKKIFVNAAHSGVPVREQKIWTKSGSLKICPYAVRYC